MMIRVSPLLFYATPQKSTLNFVVLELACVII